MIVIDWLIGLILVIIYLFEVINSFVQLFIFNILSIEYSLINYYSLKNTAGILMIVGYYVIEL